MPTTSKESTRPAKQAGAKKQTGAEKYVHRHKDGSVWATGQLLDGKPAGYWEWFRKDGTRMRSGYFDNGEQVGTWTTYRQNGDVVKVTTMKRKPK